MGCCRYTLPLAPSRGHICHPGPTRRPATSNTSHRTVHINARPASPARGPHQSHCESFHVACFPSVVMAIGRPHVGTGHTRARSARPKPAGRHALIPRKCNHISRSTSHHGSSCTQVSLHWLHRLLSDQPGPQRHVGRRGSVYCLLFLGPLAVGTLTGCYQAGLFVALLLT